MINNLKKPFLIAEAGINHNGSVNQAIKMINSAKKSGADAIKFQTYITNKRVKKNNPVYKILKKCELTHEDFEKIKIHCDKKKIIFFSTPFDIESINFLEKLKVKLYKVASFDVSNYQLLKRIISTKKPTIVSTGMASLNEIKKTYKMFKTNKVDLALLHCISSYPNKEEASYLSNIKYLKSKFDCTIGFSDHTNDINTSIYSFLLGAKIIEKHFVISKSMNCIDKPVSIDSFQFKEMKREIDRLIRILGKIKFGIRPEEKNTKIFKRKKIL